MAMMVTRTHSFVRWAAFSKASAAVMNAQPLSTTAAVRDKQLSYKLLVVGGGTAGCATASIFSRKLGKGKVAVIEPSEMHYYQPLWTLVGGGQAAFQDTFRPMGSVLPKDADWIKDRAVNFDPDNNMVTTSQGKEIKYEFLVCALGTKVDFHLIKGLPEAFSTDPMVCSIYSGKTVVQTTKAMEAFKEGNAVFSFPNTLIKCAGAPQKIAYLMEAYFRKVGKRDKANFIYNTTLPNIFSAPKYAAALWDVANSRNIKVNLRSNLVEVRPDKKEAVFQHLDTKEETVYPYALLHVGPPASTPEVLWNSPLVDETNYITVTKETLQHTKYPNVFALGDNSNLPSSKTAAAAASQLTYLKQNLQAAMAGKPLGPLQYDGYSSCPLVTGDGKCIMAEFDWNLQPLETFPIDQGKESRLMYIVKRHMIPFVHWNLMLRGHWYGPRLVRKFLHLGFGR